MLPLLLGAATRIAAPAIGRAAAGRAAGAAASGTAARLLQPAQFTSGMVMGANTAGNSNASTGGPQSALGGDDSNPVYNR